MKITALKLICLTLGLSYFSASFSGCRDVTLTGSVDSDQLWQEFTILASEQMQGRKTGTDGNLKAQQYIAEQYTALGLSDFPHAEDFYHPFIYKKGFTDIHGTNLVGWHKGNVNPEEFIVITAHYDHLGIKGRDVFYGADDNASGVAAMLSIAKDIVKNGSRYSVIFLSTDAEEKGLFGAKAFVKNPTVPIENIRYNLNLDMLSQGGRKRALYVSGSSKFTEAREIIKTTKEQAGICLIKGHRAPRSGSAVSSQMNWRKASDHAAFGKLGIAYIFVGVGVHQYYHTPLDRVEKVNREFYTGAVETSLMLFRGLDRL